MQRKQSSVEAALMQVQNFLDEHHALLHTVNKTGARAILNDVVTALRTQATDQDAYRRESKGARARHVAARRSLLVHHVRAVAGAARLELGTVPALAGITAPYARSTTPNLLSSAAGMMKAAEEHQEALARVLGPDFIDQLREATRELADAFESGRTSRAKRAGATAGVTAEVARGRAALRVLDALVLRAVAGDAGLEREWKACRTCLATPRRTAVPLDNATTEQSIAAAGGMADAVTPPAAVLVENGPPNSLTAEAKRGRMMWKVFDSFVTPPTAKTPTATTPGATLEVRGRRHSAVVRWPDVGKFG